MKQTSAWPPFHRAAWVLGGIASTARELRRSSQALKSSLTITSVSEEDAGVGNSPSAWVLHSSLSGSESFGLSWAE